MNILRKMFVLAFVLTMACGGDDKEPQGPLGPTNLSFTVEVATDGLGGVTVNATAENATKYIVFFGEPGSDTPVETTDGVATYTYSESGTYTIKVVATNDTPSTTNLTKEVQVTVNPPANLDFTAEVASDGSGEVSIQASAENVKKYKIFFGDNDNEVGVNSVDGSVVHQYAESGTYTIRVVASNDSKATSEVSKDVEVNVVSPENLNFTVDIATDGSGSASVSATATNATEYQVFFGENLNDTGISSTDGNALYQYGSSGTYTVKVVAKNNSLSATEATQEVEVTVVPNIPTTGYTTPTSYDGMTLVWSDEFNGTALNESDWTFEIGRGSNGWGNNELQYYRRENTEFHEGNLVITAKNQEFGGAKYTSTRIVTKDKKIFKYGRIDIRAVLPKGQGIWPALWMLGNNIGSVGWPKCGEIDIMEMVGGSGTKNSTVYGTLHWDNAGTRVCTCDKPGHTISSGTFNDEYHVFSIVWDATSIKWYVDDVKFNDISITPAELSEFHNDFFFIFNLAVGGNWPGSPDGTTVFPQRLIVDYVRVFQ